MYVVIFSQTENCRLPTLPWFDLSLHSNPCNHIEKCMGKIIRLLKNIFAWKGALVDCSKPKQLSNLSHLDADLTKGDIWLLARGRPRIVRWWSTRAILHLEQSFKHAFKKLAIKPKAWGLERWIHLRQTFPRPLALNYWVCGLPL